MSGIEINTIAADGLSIFYRTAGSPTLPVILLLHGFPTSSHQFRHIIPLLSHNYHVIAPDLPGFGFTQVPASRNYQYTFANIATSIIAFIDALKLTKFSVYIFDYGAPTGLRIALERPESITAIITQNGNAYTEGLGEFWNPIKEFWVEDTPQKREELSKALLTFDATKWQYEFGVTDPARLSAIEPEGYYLDQALMERSGNKDIQLGLFKDYENNVALYPRFQEYLNEKQPPVLALWGRNDAIFVPAGAEAFKRDVKKVEIKFFETGHFALETHLKEISLAVVKFLGNNV
ncbi:alpha/beta hydrolase fold protein [Morchella snyderi]|nr:alpha/beta hydrolase fold protein [Morchella snyderi]